MTLPWISDKPETATAGGNLSHCWIYIASGISNRPNVDALARRLESRGAKILCKWWNANEEDFRDGILTKDQLLANQRRAIRRCNTFILLYPAGRGSHLEMGYAERDDESRTFYVVGCPDPSEVLDFEADGEGEQTIFFEPSVEELMENIA